MVRYLGESGQLEGIMSSPTTTTTTQLLQSGDNKNLTDIELERERENEWSETEYHAYSLTNSHQALTRLRSL